MFLSKWKNYFLFILCEYTHENLELCIMVIIGVRISIIKCVIGKCTIAVINDFQQNIDKSFRVKIKKKHLG